MNLPSVKKNFLYSTLFQILNVITPFITSPYLSRVLGPDGVGIQSYTASIQAYFLLFASLGTYTYGAREIARTRNDKSLYSKIFWEIEIMTVITSGLGLLLWWGLIMTNPAYQSFYIAMIPNLFAVMFDITWFFNGLEQFRITIMRSALFKVLGIFLMFLFVKSKDDLLLYVMIVSVTSLLSSLSLWTYLPGYLAKITFRGFRLRHHLKQTLVYFLPSLATSVYTMLDKALLGLLTGDNFQNGYYAQADKMITIAKSVSFIAINSVVGVRVSYLFSEKKIDEVHTRIERSMNYILFMGIGCMFGIAGIAENMVPVFLGGGYEKVIPLLYIFCPIIVIIGISNCIGGHYYTPSGRRSQSTKYLVAGSVTNLVLNLTLIPFFAANGAAVASILAESVITVLYVKNSSKFMTFRLIARLSIKKITAGAVMLAVVAAVRKVPGPGEILIIGIQLVLGAFTYLAVLSLLRDSWMYYLFELIKNKRKFRRAEK